jgi:hypothetical protein
MELLNSRRKPNLEHWRIGMMVKELIQMLQSLEHQNAEIRIPFLLGRRERYLEITGVSESPGAFEYATIDWSDE